MLACLHPQLTLDWYPLVGGSTGIGVTVTVNGLKMVMQASCTCVAWHRAACRSHCCLPPPTSLPLLQGNYGYNATSSPKQTCITSAAVSSTVISYSSISGQFTINGGNAGALPTKVRSLLARCSA